MSGTPASRFSWRNVLVLTFIFMLPLLGFAVWQCQLLFWNNDVDIGRLLTGYLKRNGIPTKLADTFVDANGDLIADAPTDPKKQLDPPELVFAPIAPTSTRDTEEVWRQFLDHLAKVTGKKVSFATFDEHNSQIAALNDGKLHVTAFNTGYVPIAVNAAGFAPQVALAKADGSFTYQVDIIVPQTSSMKSVQDLKVKKEIKDAQGVKKENAKLTVTATGSHSGFKAPLIILNDEFQLMPQRDYDFVISGGHAQSIKAICAGKAAAATVASDLLEETLADPRAEIKPDQYRVIYHSKDFPRAAYGVNSRLKPELAEKVKEAFLTFDFKGTKLEEMVRGSKTTKFVAIDYKKDWAPVRAVDEKLLAWK